MKAEAAILAEESRGKNIGRAICADRGVRLPLLSSSSMSSAVKPVGLCEGSTGSRGKHVIAKLCSE